MSNDAVNEISNKRANFRRLAEARTTSTLDAIRKLANLSSSNYEYDEAEVQKIFEVLDEALKQARNRFGQSGGGKRRFSLSD